MTDLPVERTGQEEPAPAAPNKFLLLLKSRKFWAALIGIIVMVVKNYDPNFPLSEEQITSLVMVVIAYILGTSLEDGLRSGAVK